jgi:SAM-dependent methyltransferase
MAWYAEPADEGFWYRYWQSRLTPEYYRAAKKRELGSDELGQVLLGTMDREGLHLEAGCGAGYWVAALRGRDLDVEGIEYSRPLVKLVNQICPEVPIRYGNALSIERPSGYYDSYLSFGVVEHRVEGPDPFLAEAYRVLKARGKILITVPLYGFVRSLKHKAELYDPARAEADFFQYGFKKREFVKLLQNAGFETLTVRPLQVHRLLIEELPIYRWLSFQRGSRFLRRMAEMILQDFDGHMLLVVGQKT